MKINKELIFYLIFGVLTTLVNIISYWLLSRIFHMDYKLATTIAWLLSVIFAFITNKLYVFNSRSLETKTLAKEFISFIFFRILSYLVDLAVMVVMIEWIKSNDIFAKIIANIIVVILNFFASKFLIFSRSEKNN
ncbi:GtrA family protein [Neobacillus sp. Marseille-QA0830]